MESAERTETGFCQWCPVPEQDWAQTGTQEFPSDHQEALLYCVGDGALVQTVHRACGALSLEIFKRCFDKILVTLLWVSVLMQGLGQMDPERPSKHIHSLIM